MKTIPLTALLWFPLHARGWQSEPKLLWNRPMEKPNLSVGPASSSGTPTKQATFSHVEHTGPRRNKRPRTPLEVKLLRRHDELEHSVFQPSKFNLQVDPWGVDKQQSHLSLPFWAFTDENEQRHLAAMKVVLGRDLEMLEERTITFSDGRTIKVAEAFPDVYGDFRLLRFLRKDKVQDPVTAAVRYRQFLQWREDNNVDEIRLQIEERLRRGENNVFVPPTDIVSKYLPCIIKPLKSCNGLVPVVLEVGEWDTKGLTKLIQGKELSMREFLAYWIHIYEALNLHLYQESFRTQRLVSVEELCDLSGLTLAHFSHPFVSHVLKPWVEMTQANYPETAMNIVFLRPPRIFSLIWKWFSPLFSKGTVEKVTAKSNFDTSNLSFCPSSVTPEGQSSHYPKATIPDGYTAILI